MRIASVMDSKHHLPFSALVKVSSKVGGGVVGIFFIASWDLTNCVEINKSWLRGPKV